jgi:hypothetical protein
LLFRIFILGNLKFRVLLLSKQKELETIKELLPDWNYEDTFTFKGGG